MKRPAGQTGVTFNRGLALTKGTGLAAKIPANVSEAWLAHIRSLATP
ncbi:hypothetical protein [Streptomyces xylophagus]|nr:hypothetical protein [Streptomyces xylophagus]